MSTILVLDDVPDYSEELARALSRNGNLLRTASTAQEAIEIGAAIEPDIFVTDWMLRDHVNGLDVAEVLRQVYPPMQTILMTGFASGDLIDDAKESGVVDFLEKPFPMERIREAVSKAERARMFRRPASPIGIVETYKDGAITLTNAFAEELMSQTDAGAFTVNFQDYFSADDWKRLARAKNEWVEVAPVSARPHTWLVRAKEIGSENVRLWAILDKKHQHLRDSHITLRLLGFSEQRPKGLENCGHVLIIDDFASVRRMATTLLRAMKLFCHATENHQEAIRIFAHDPEITHVLCDYDMPDGEPWGLIQKIKEMRPHVQIIGASTPEHRAAFEAAGVRHFLPKPWDFEEFVRVLQTTNRDENPS